MIVRLDNPKLLSEAISIISEVVSEVRIKLQEDGMSIVAVDPANVAMVIFKLPRQTFSQYESGNETWGINLSDLKMILRRTSSGGSVVFEQEDNRLKISVFDNVKRVFNLSLIEIDSEDKTEPSLNFSCGVEMNSEMFSQAIEDCAIVADSCSFACGEGFFMMDAAGSLNSARTEFSESDVKVSGSGKSKYSLEYLMKFIKAGKLAEKVSIKFSNSYPLRLNYAGEKMGLGFVLAPRVEND